jgi:nucleotide-binding universal stress UspA family protein
MFYKKRQKGRCMTKTDNRSPYILVAEDYSTEARAAAEAALQIARKQNLMIRGLYVVDEILALDTYADYHAELPFMSKASDGGRREPTSRTELIGWFETQGEAALQWLKTACVEAGVSVSTNLLAGGVSELVIRDAAQAQMLALGRRGHGHKDDLTSLGHNFRKIAHQVYLPMLVGGLKTSSLQHLLLAYHGQAHADEALAWTIRLQRDLAAEVIVLCVCEDSPSCSSGMSLEAIKARLAQSGLKAYRFLTSQGRPSSEIAAIASANDIDLIILGRYRHAALVEWLVGSTVDRLLRVTSLPMLIT